MSGRITHSLGKTVNSGALWDGSSHSGWESKCEWQVVASEALQCQIR